MSDTGQVNRDREAIPENNAPMVSQMLNIMRMSGALNMPSYNAMLGILDGTHTVVPKNLGARADTPDEEKQIDRAIAQDSAKASLNATLSSSVRTYDSGFKFGEASKKEMQGVRVILQQIANMALARCPQDFTFYDGLRTYKQQEDMVRRGVSKTMQSKHLSGDAMDLVPWHNGKPVWEWERIYPIVVAVDSAATELGVANKIVWGGAWDRRLSDFEGDVKEIQRVCEQYVARRRAAGQKAVFIDGPHFEWRD